ncbi:hypothetical protein BGZ63DRAFT_420311 [Mariannaea sp. PMI_226]|nr:hypothetical protein BGZ63DRAFT_420311 [Mariannaea sp. PMI_226]
MEQLNSPDIMEQVACLRHRRHDTVCYFEKNVLSFCLNIIASCFFWDGIQPGFDALSKGYLAWRAMWYLFVFRNTEDMSERRKARKDGTGLDLIWNAVERKLFREVQLWGNIENDWNLYHYQELTAKDLRYLYEQDVDCLRYILENLKYWDVECQILNDYVGLRRYMPREQFHKAKTEAQRAGTAMRRVLEAEDRLGQSGKPLDLEVLGRRIYAAKTCFLQLRGVLCAKPIPTFQPPRPDAAQPLLV